MARSRIADWDPEDTVACDAGTIARGNAGSQCRCRGCETADDESIKTSAHRAAGRHRGGANKFGSRSKIRRSGGTWNSQRGQIHR